VRSSDEVSGCRSFGGGGEPAVGGGKEVRRAGGAGGRQRKRKEEKPRHEEGYGRSRIPANVWGSFLQHHLLMGTRLIDPIVFMSKGNQSFFDDGYEIDQSVPFAG
jgi:hypothetical protein